MTQLVEEQAALRRVATAVAGGAQPEVVFSLVTEEAGRLLGASSAGTIRYEPDEKSAIVVGRWHGTGPPGMEVGTQGAGGRRHRGGPRAAHGQAGADRQL